MRFLRVVAPIAAVALLFASCAAKLPQAEVDAAAAAFAEAKAAQADALAADAFKVASDANDALQSNLTAKEYGKTKALAKTLLDASASAKTAAAAGLETAKASIAQLGGDIGAEIPSLQKALAAATAKKAKIDLKTIKSALAAAPQALTDAQANADVVASRAALEGLKAELDGYKSTLEAAGFKAE